MARTSYTTPEGRITRDQLARSAMAAFAARGYHGASLETIAGEVGVSRQALLHYFPTKVKLLLAVLELRDEEDSARLNEFAQRHDGSLRETLGELVRHNLTRPGLVQLYTVLSAEGVDPDHPAHDWFVERYRNTRALLDEWIGVEQANGRVQSTMAPEHLAVAVIALLDGLQLQSLLEPGVIDSARVLEEIMNLLGAT